MMTEKPTKSEESLNELALFAGAGGGILGGKLLGWRTQCAVEIDPYCRSILFARQRDGMLPRFPIWDDVQTFDGRPWREHIDVVSGGFPCQDISAAGKGEGLAGKRSGLWFEMLRIIKEIQPRFVFAENSPNLRTRGLGIVIEGLTHLGYGCRWCVLGAWHAGAPHRRNRMWILAHTTKQHWAQQRHETFKSRRGCEFKQESWWSAEPDVGRVVDGLAHRVDRLKAIGNGQVPAVAAIAWTVLSGGLQND